MKPFILPRGKMPTRPWQRISSAYNILLDEWLAISLKLPADTTKAMGTRLYGWWQELGVACEILRQAKEQKGKTNYRRAFSILHRINKLNQQRHKVVVCKTNIEVLKSPPPSWQQLKDLGLYGINK